LAEKKNMGQNLLTGPRILWDERAWLNNEPKNKKSDQQNLFYTLLKEVDHEWKTGTRGLKFSRV
jgi:hypothetical protein